jgi:hypothetical protein
MVSRQGGRDVAGDGGAETTVAREVAELTW